MDKESKLLFGNQNMLGIYQLKDNEVTRNFYFEGSDFLKRKGIPISKDNYELVYTEPLKRNMGLESIYMKFNLERPSDFKGHSLSVSDIVVLNQDGIVSSHFVDSFGFKDVPDFTKGMKKYYDPEYGRFVTEEVIKGQYEMFKNNFSWFDKPYEQFRDDNFREVPDEIINPEQDKDRISYYVIADMSTWADNSSQRAHLDRFDDLSDAVSEFMSVRNRISGNDDTVETAFGVCVSDAEFDLVYAKNDECLLSLDFTQNESVKNNKAFKDVLKEVCNRLNVRNVRIHREMSPEEIKDFTNQKFKEHLKNSGCEDIEYYMSNFDKVYEQGKLDRYMPSMAQRKIVEDVPFQDWSRKQPYFEINEPDEMAFFSPDDDRFISIQKCTDGYDYSVYADDYKLIDGGVYDDPDISIQTALTAVCADYIGSTDKLEPVDYDEIMEKVEKAESCILQNIHKEVETDNRSKRKSR